MMKNKAITRLSALILALGLIVSALSANVLIASAAETAIPTPKVEGISYSKLTEYKDLLFYVGEFDYTEDYTLNYRYYLPSDTSEGVPLIIFLHGRGERGSDNDSQLNNAILRPFIESEDSKFYNAMVIAPQCPVKDYNNGWVNLFTDDEAANSLAYKNYSTESVPESTECKAIVSLIGDTCNRINIDRNRIYLIGLSQGALATWDLLARHSELFAAAVPIAGVGDKSKAEIYADIPIYAFHGDADTTVPYATATPEMYRAIDAVGKNKMNFVTFTGGPHAIWESAIVFKGSGDLPALEDWLFAQTKKSAQIEDNTDSSSSAPVNSSSDETKEKSGCKSAISVEASVLMMVLILLSSAFVLKKKEEK